MSKHNQHKKHRAFSSRFYAFFHCKKGPPLATRQAHSRVVESPIVIDKECAKVFSPTSEAEAPPQDALPSSESASLRGLGFNPRIFGFLVQLHISRPQNGVSRNARDSDSPPPYSGARRKRLMEYPTEIQEMSGVDCRIAELMDPNSYHELPASHHSYCVKAAGYDPISLSALKRSSDTSRKGMRGYLDPIPTPGPTPFHSPRQYSQIAPEMTDEEISPTSSLQSPFTPKSNAVFNKRRRSSSSFNISPLTQREMPLPAIREDIEVAPAYINFQRHPSDLELPSHRQAMMSLLGTISSTTGFAYESNTSGSPYTPYCFFDSSPQYYRSDQIVTPCLYPPAAHGQGGFNQYENSAWHHEYRLNLPILDNVNHQYHNVNADQKTCPRPGYPPGEKVTQHIHPHIAITVGQTGKLLSAACEICGAIFSGRYCKGNKQRHVKTKHSSNQPMFDRTCGVCHRIFNRGDAARKHERNAHKPGSPNRAKKQR